MKIKIKYLCLLQILIFMIHNNIGSTQCNIENIQALGYINGSCNKWQFQSLIGSITSSYGKCGSLFFDSPISGKDIQSSSEDITTSYSVEIYPNPTLGNVFIKSTSDHLQNIELYSSLGVLISSEKINNVGTTQLTMDHLHAGYYFIKVSGTNSNSKIIKIIKI